VCLDVCLPLGRQTFFSNRYSSYSFYLILTKLGTHTRDPCATTEKKLEQIYEIKKKLLANF